MLFERDEPLAALARALDASRAQGQLAAVSGEAGVGKTSLLEALAAGERDVAFLWGACEALDTPRPLGPLLDMAPALDADVEAALRSGNPRHQVFGAFLDSLARRSPPTVVVFEDVHWADVATLDLLRFVGRRIHRIQALLVVTWRADEVGANHPLYRVLGEIPTRSMHRIELRPLSFDTVAQMAGPLHDARTVFTLTNGNPFFVTELLRSAGGTVPVSVRDAILARRAVLPVATRQVIDAISVVPSRAEIEIVRAHAANVADAVVPAVDAGLLNFDGRTLGFRHELARLAVLASLPLIRVQDLHRSVLATLSPLSNRPGVLARLVHHAVGAGDADAVQRFAPMAAQQAAALGAHREAAAHYRTALAWADGLAPSVRAEIGDLLSYECYLTGEMADARDARVDALRLWRQLNVPKAIGRDIRWLSRLAWFLGDHAEATARAVEALEVLAPLGEDEELAMALSNRAQLHMLAREHDRCLEIGGRAIEMARRLRSVDVLSHALNNVGTRLMIAGSASGRQMLEESLSLALGHDLHEHAARAFTNLATSSLQLREYDYAQRQLNNGIRYCVERDLDSWALYLLGCRGRLFAETGRWAEAEADAAAVIENRRASVVARIPALAALGLIRARRRAEAAADLLEEALAIAVPTAESQRLVPVRAARAELALLEGRLDAARAEADAGLECLTPDDPPWDWELLRYLRWRADGGRRPPKKKAGAAVAGSGPHALQMRGEWRAAADAWARFGCPYERADALADGDVPAMEEALQMFVALGAAAAADRVRQRLRDAGVTRLRRGPRASTRAHPAGLTRRESEILGLIAGRLSNQAIADRLFVSAKTVEHHVSAILAKLKVSTREQAVVEGRRRGWLP
jgi:DNA-binding CsgD family transcriptional regulator/tetratricopeptide (TPR) repeat protein